MKSESLQDKKHISGLHSARGYEFEKSYILSQLPEWLSLIDLDFFQQELWSDLELFFKSGKRWLLQIKNHKLELTEFREIIRDFQRRQNESDGQYERYTIVSTGVVSSVQQIWNMLERWRDTQHLGDAELASTKADFISKLREHNFEEFADFIIANTEKMHLQGETGWVKNEELIQNLFVSSLSTNYKISQKDAKDLYFRIARRLATERGKRIELLPFREELGEKQKVKEQSSDNDVHELLSVDDYSSPVPLFLVGREKELNQLNTAFQYNNIVVIGGTPGIGKTYLAAGFAQKLKETHPIWLECEPHVQLEQFLTGLARFVKHYFNDSSLLEVLHLPTTSETQRTKSAVAVLNRHSCMLIWDGFDQTANHSFLPLLKVCSRELRQGKLLITTQEWVDIDDLFNPPSCLPPLSPLDKESGIKLMQDLEIGDLSYEILTQAYERVHGHPKFITMLVSLSKLFPLPNLLDELPHVTKKVYTDLQQKVFDTLEPSAKQLLQKLSILRIPFQISVINYLTQSPDGYNAFDTLLSRFLVTLHSQDSPYYEIHGLVREFAQKQTSEIDLPSVHKQLHAYYKALPKKRYLDEAESIYHALNAAMLDEAIEASNRLLRGALYEGLYDLVLEYTSWLLSDDRTRKWGFIYHMRGRALRFKRQLSESLDAYRAALEFALNVPDEEAAKMEIASVLVILSELK